MLLLFALAGCGARPDQLQLMVEQCAELEGGKASPNARLRQQIAEVEAEQAAPAQLGRPLPPDDENVAAALAAAFGGERGESLFEEAGEFFQRSRFRFNAIELERIKNFSRRHRSTLDELAAGLARPQCNFAIPFERGHFVDLVFIDEVTAASRMVGLTAAVSLEEHAIGEAVEQAIAMMTLVEHLARERHLESRVAAANLRAEVLLVWEAILQHDRLEPEGLRALHRCLSRQLERWPSDRGALEGERAVTMHAYELIRLGQLEVLLTREEKKRFLSEGILSDLLAVAADHVDSDEQYYLASMRQFIDLCRLPYFQRLSDYAELSRGQVGTEPETSFPILAIRLFLPDLIPSLRVLAKDRARCDAWLLAMEVALGGRPQAVVNSHTGREMRVTLAATSVVVDLGEEGERDPLIPFPVDDSNAATLSSERRR